MPKSPRAVVAVPPIEDFYFTPARASSLGAVTVKNILQKAGVETVLLNFPVMKKKASEIPLPGELSYLKPFIITGEKGPVSFFSSYRRFGPDYEECAAIAAAHRPGIIFISCFAWAYASETIKLAEAFKNHCPDTPLVTGGAGVSVNPDYFREKEYIDFVLSGEAESVLPSFLKSMYGINVYPGDQQFSWNQTGISERKQIRYISLSVSRGCPRGCRFCSNHIVQGRKFRKIQPEAVENEIKKIPVNMNVHFNFEDDNLLLDREYFFEILGIIKKRFPDAVFSAENGLDYSLMDEKTTDALIKSGFRSFNLSMASYSENILMEEKRFSDIGRLEIILNLLKGRNIGSTTYFICGLQGDSAESTIANLMFLHRLPTLTGISMFYPVPGIPGFEDIGSFASISPKLCAGSSAWPWTESLTTVQMITAFRLSRVSNMIKTAEHRLPSVYSSGILNDPEKELFSRITREKLLFTTVRGQIRPVPDMDGSMLSSFLDFTG